MLKKILILFVGVVKSIEINHENYVRQCWEVYDNQETLAMCASSRYYEIMYRRCIRE